MKKALVVYYSRSGTTRHVARDVATALGADLDAIETVDSRSGTVGFLRSGLESLAKGLPTIRTGELRDPASYDLVALGTPVWTRTMAAPVRTYLHLYRRHLPRLSFFCTMGSHGAPATLRELSALCGVTDPVTFSATASDVRWGRHEARLEDYVETLLLSLGDVVGTSREAAARTPLQSARRA